MICLVAPLMKRCGNDPDDMAAGTPVAEELSPRAFFRRSPPLSGQVGRTKAQEALVSGICGDYPWFRPGPPKAPGRPDE